MDSVDDDNNDKENEEREEDGEEEKNTCICYEWGGTSGRERRVNLIKIHYKHV